MIQNRKRYRTYSDYMKEKYGEKIYKLPISLPVTCPNRDGSCGQEGCVFCGSIGAGYENLPAHMTVAAQLAANIAHIAPKYKAEKYLAYFQNFSNTYLSPRQMGDYVRQAVRPDVVGAALATRPDCIHDRHLEELAQIRKETGLDIALELGLQTVNYHTLAAIHRGHGLAEFIDAVQRIRPYGFEICAHLILNLPWDDRRDVTEAARILSALGVQQVKLHALYIIKGTQMAQWYERGEITLIDKEEYIERVITFLEQLHPNIVLQRLIGRAPASHTLFSNWGTGWWKIRDQIEKNMEERDTWQGKLCTYLNGPAVQKWVKDGEEQSTLAQIR